MTVPAVAEIGEQAIFEGLNEGLLVVDSDGTVLRANVSQIRNWQQEPVGHAMIVREISHIVTREQRLAVLNRILRHNVRNETARTSTRALVGS